MNPNEQEFEQVMRTNKATIYTVCYMFSNDQDEVADLFRFIQLGMIILNIKYLQTMKISNDKDICNNRIRRFYYANITRRLNSSEY